jgi:hypothetical protein
MNSFSTFTPIHFTQVASWSSFDKFKLEGATALERVANGSVGLLTTKSGQYRILTDSDFQSLLGLASEVRRIKEGLNAIIATATVARRHRDSESLEALMQVVIAVGDLPRLPSNAQVTALNLEELETDSGDAILDAVALKAAQLALTELP